MLRSSNRGERYHLVRRRWINEHCCNARTFTPSLFVTRLVFSSSLEIRGFCVSPSQEETNRTKYPWNEYQINLVLGSFFWGYVCTELPGGRLAEVVGTKRVFGYSMLVSSAITFLTPLSATYGYVAVVVLRTLLGLMLVGFPCAVQV